MHSAMVWLHKYEVPLIATGAAVLLGWIIGAAGTRFIDRNVEDPREYYRRRKFLSTSITIVAVIIIIAFWGAKFPHQGTFFGLIGAGLAVGLREPLLSLASRIAIFAGHIFSVGDRIEIDKMKGDVIDIGFFYTRMMEIGNWVHGDQYSGRIVQFPNAKFWANPVFNYTRTFSYIWDEICIPITYDSNLKAATEILLAVSSDYTKAFLKNADAQLRQMQRYFVVERFQTEPQVYITVTSNWTALSLRYVVDPKRRRNATTFLYGEIFNRMQQREDITIASETMDVTVHAPQAEALKLARTEREPEEDKAA